MEIPDINHLSRRARTENYFKRNYPEFLQFLQDKYKDYDIPFTEQLYLYHNNTEPGTCKVCGKPTKYIDWNNGYRQYCSCACNNKSAEKNEKRKQIFLEKHGVENPSQLESVKEKKKQTMIRHYGVESPSQSKEIQEKAKQTNLKRYGVEYASQSEEIQKKIKQTNQNKYGNDYAIGSKEIRDKIKASKLERHGDENYTNREKWHETCKERYGADNTFESEEVKEKIKQTCLEKYGIENALLSSEIRERAKETLHTQYGVENPSQIEGVTEKAIQTKIERYGKAGGINMELTRKTKLERYGDENYTNREQAQRTCLEKYGVKSVSQLESVKEKKKQTCLERYSVESSIYLPNARIGSNNSKPNKKFAQLLTDNNIEFGREFAIDNRIYDFKVGDVLVEINPYATHNSTWGYVHRAPTDKNYHKNKSLLAFDNGFECICVWDWDDLNKIVNLLKNKQSIGARKCIVKEVNKKECDEFLVNNHLQGTCKGQIVRLGLYYKDKLIEIMTFGKPRYNKNVEWELLRLCSDSDNIVVGGSNKLFKYFIEHYNPNSIVSYCDLSKFSGRVYDELGFRRERLANPSKHWYHPKTKLHITDNLLRQRGFDQLFDADYGKGTSNEQLMIEHGFVEIYDCGQATFIWNE